MSRDASFGLDRDGLSAAFPFHFVVTPDGTIAQLGPGLQKVLPTAAGSALTNHFEPHRPRAALDYADLANAAPQYLVVRMTASGVLWRGQTLRGEGHVTFLGTPWFTDPSELGPIGVSLQDFAPHDSLLDYLTLLQTKNTALRDANRLSEHLRRTRQQLQLQLDVAQAERRRLETLVETVPWGVLVEDENGRIALTNRPFCELFLPDCTPDDLIGTPCQNAVARVLPMFADPDSFVREIQATLQANEQRLSVPVRTQDGRTLERDYIPIVNDGHFLGHMWQYRDLTERHNARQQLEDARSKAEAANAAKSEFLAMMSHEMRTPLGVVVGIAELLRKESTTGSRDDLVQRLNDNSQALLQLIDSTLDFARLENQQVEIRAEPFSPCELAEAVATSLLPEARHRGVRIVLDLASDTPQFLRGDELRIRQVMTNLLGNALKFTDGSEVVLRLRVEATGDDACRTRWQVEDRGPGIAADRQDTIFERFVRAVPAASSREGTGLGLAVCRELCRAMGGTIELDSTLGTGSTFSVALPLPRVTGRDANPTPLTGYRVEIACHSAWLASSCASLLTHLGADADEVSFRSSEADALHVTDPKGDTRRLVIRDHADSDDEAGIATPLTRTALLQALGFDASSETSSTVPPHARQRCGSRVLVVDDDRDSVEISDMMLRAAGFSVVTADGVAAATRRLEVEPFDLVVTDLRMPDGGGLALLERITTLREEQFWPALHSIVLSAETVGSSKTSVLQAGAKAYATKPIGTEQFVAVVEQHVDRRPVILYLEDDASMRMLVSARLATLATHRVISCADPRQALHIVEHYQIELAILDHRIGAESGLEVVAPLLASGTSSVVAFTGSTEPDDRQACLDAGCVAVWNKPLTMDVLYHNVTTLLAKADNE